ncbi:hypothetical protein GWK26_11965 [haloarchaeon 3A1-DGR]|nr:hypothetical protein GWK26_11965 [haloarchaeon 3A1-DGR]
MRNSDETSAVESHTEYTIARSTCWRCGVSIPEHSARSTLCPDCARRHAG